MFIEDEELRALYQASSAEHLEKIESGLMHLEKNADDAEQLNVLLRSMHSLKGDSRMLGVDDAEKVVHQMEDLLIEVQDGKSTFTPGLCDRLYKGLDATRKIAEEAVGGPAANLNLFLVLAGLMADVDETPAPANPLSSVDLAVDIKEEDLLNLQESEVLEQARLQMEQQASPISDIDEMDAELDALLGVDAAPSSEVASTQESIQELLIDDGETSEDLLTSLLIDTPAPEAETSDVPSGHVTPSTRLTTPESITPSEKPSSSPAKPEREREKTQIESIRVAASKLDTLMNQADELTVTKLGIARHQDDLSQMYRLWEDWSRELSLLNIGGAQSLGSGESTVQQAFLRTTQERLAQLGEALVQVRHSAAEDMARLNAVANSLESGIRNLRLMPLSSIFNVFPRMVRDLSRQQGKTIDLEIDGGDTLVDKRILEELKDPLTHLIRNAIDHGIETIDERLVNGKSEKATIRLRGFQMGDRVGVELIDDGQGLDIKKIRATALRKNLFSEAELQAMSQAQIQNLIFAPGFSTKTTVTEISGRGVGLDVVRANVQRLKGTLEVESVPGQGCQFRLLMNANLASTHALIVEVKDEVFALPIDAVETLLLLNRDALFNFDGKLAIRWQEQPTAVQWLADLLNLEETTPETPPTLNQIGQKIPCVLMKVNGVYFGLLVDQLIDQEHLILKPKSQFLRQVPNVRGSAILGSGDICMVLEPGDLLQSAQGKTPIVAEIEDLLHEAAVPKVLLVEDSLVIRTQMIRILSGAGFDVTAAVDGKDGFEKLQAGEFQIVVSDVEMPNMSGLEMTQTIRSHQKYSDLPIVLVTTLANAEDKQRGADAGATAYLTKGDFDQTLLLDTLRSLI